MKGLEPQGLDLDMLQSSYQVPLKIICERSRLRNMT